MAGWGTIKRGSENYELGVEIHMADQEFGATPLHGFWTRLIPPA